MIPNNRLQKMRLKLLTYDIELKYLPGKKMFIADLLSRNFLSEKYENELNIEGTVHCINRFQNRADSLYNIKKASESDTVLSQILRYYIQGWPEKKCINDQLKMFYNMKNDITVEDGIVYYDNRVIIPHSLRKNMLRLLHESHQGIVKTKLRAKNIMYWPGMLNEIEQFVSDCTICEKFRSDNRKDPLLPHEIPTLPFEKIGSDVLTYRNKDYLVTIDYYSKWIEVTELENKNSAELISKLKYLFSMHGIPRILICDNMPFGSFEFKKFADSWNFRIVTSSPRYPRSNGLSEKAVGIAKQMLKKKFEENKDINISLLEYRSTVIPTMGASPSELLMSRLLRTKLPAHHLKLKPKLQENVEDKLKSNQYQYKSYHDNRAKRHVTKFEPNQNVVIRRDKVWEPGKILNTANTPRSYIVQDHKGEVLRRNSLHLRPSNNEPLCVNRNAIEHASQESSDNASDPDVSLNTSLPPITTRSGRTVKKPSKYNDYVL